MDRIRNKFGRFDPQAFAPAPVFAGHARGLSAAPFVDHADETVHMAYGVTRLDAGGETELVTHAYEKALFLLDGRLELARDGHIWSLGPGDTALIPTGTEHAFRNRDGAAAQWVEMAAPQPKAPGGWQDTWFAGAAD